MKTELNAVTKDAIAAAQMPEELFLNLYNDLVLLPLALDTTDDVFEVVRRHNLLRDDEVVPGNFILFAFYQMADRGDKSLSQVIERFVEDAKREVNVLGLNIDLAETLQNRLERLSSLENVITSVKASFLMAERDKLLLSSRVVSDLRPILEDDLSNPAMLILNTLKLEYQKDGEKQSAYIGLDKQDIADLIAQLERAQRKANSLGQILKQSQIRVIE